MSYFLLKSTTFFVLVANAASFGPVLLHPTQKYATMNKITKKTNNGNKKKEGKKKTSKLDELTRENEEDEKRDEMEVEYLKKLLVIN